MTKEEVLKMLREGEYPCGAAKVVCDVVDGQKDIIYPHEEIIIMTDPELTKDMVRNNELKIKYPQHWDTYESIDDFEGDIATEKEEDRFYIQSFLSVNAFEGD